MRRKCNTDTHNSLSYIYNIAKKRECQLSVKNEHFPQCSFFYVKNKADRCNNTAPIKDMFGNAAHICAVAPNISEPIKPMKWEFFIPRYSLLYIELFFIKFNGKD